MSSAVQALFIEEGRSRSRVVVTDLKRTRLVQYAGASGDYNPVHSDHPFAVEAAGYPGVFAHVMLTMGLAATVLTRWVGRENLLEYGVRFRAQVWPGDTLTATAVVERVWDDADGDGRRVQFALTVDNQSGVAVLSGTATARLEG
ncbi:MaoC/PaaZ C-terminal domain-containing protein [Streptomyces sp. KL116D]|uniref:MaoC/PaaZ C-terminal domain-containing protein n=1 Tax=Streptomyces sp. KL116D TaxID=3045152 RepID=UPI003557E178